MALKSLNTIIVSPMVVVVKPFLENKEKIMVKSERLFFSIKLKGYMQNCS